MEENALRVIRAVGIIVTAIAAIVGTWIGLSDSGTTTTDAPPAVRLEPRTPSNPQLEAASKLDQMGIPVTEEAFIEHVKQGNAERVKLLLMAGIRPDTMCKVRLPPGKSEWVLKVTALTKAALDGHKDIVRVLVDAGADVNAEEIIIQQSKDKDRQWAAGATPLMFVADYGTNEAHVEIVRILIQAGADVHVKDDAGLTALSLVSRHDSPRPEIVRLLLQAGANPNARSRIGITPLMVAASRGHLALTQVLIQAGADVNAKSNPGDTPLLYAVWKGHAEVAGVLIQAGVDVNAKSKTGSTVLTLTDDPDFLRLLRNAGARVQPTGLGPPPPPPPSARSRWHPGPPGSGPAAGSG